MSRFAICLSGRQLCRCFPALFLGFTVAASAAFAQSTATKQYSSSADDASSQLLDQGSGVLSYHSQESGQNSGGYGNGGYRQYPRYGEPTFHHLAIEAGAGFGAPLANTSKTQTFGYNVKLGGGWNFNRRFGVLVEYEFNRNGIPENVLRAVGAPDGHVHLWGFGVDPIVYYKTSGKVGRIRDRRRGLHPQKHGIHRHGLHWFVLLRLFRVLLSQLRDDRSRPFLEQPTWFEFRHRSDA